MREYFANIYGSIKSIWIGLAVTLRYMGKQTVTLQYPDEMVPVAPRFRGFHEYEIERCIACGQCANACPIDCITIESEGKGKAATIKRYAIDYGKCLFCALCVDPCPTECIHMGKLHDLSSYTRAEAVVEFTELARQGRRTPEPIWLKAASEAGAGQGKRAKQAPPWVRVLEEYYRGGAPIEWKTVGDVDRAKPKKHLSWADR